MINFRFHLSSETLKIFKNHDSSLPLFTILLDVDALPVLYSYSTKLLLIALVYSARVQSTEFKFPKYCPPGQHSPIQINSNQCNAIQFNSVQLLASKSKFQVRSSKLELPRVESQTTRVIAKMRKWSLAITSSSMHNSIGNSNNSIPIIYQQPKPNSFHLLYGPRSTTFICQLLKPTRLEPSQSRDNKRNSHHSLAHTSMSIHYKPSMFRDSSPSRFQKKLGVTKTQIGTSDGIS